MVSRFSALLWLTSLILSISFCLNVFGVAAAPPSANAAESRKQHVADRSVITARNLFGLPAERKMAEAAVSPLADLPATSLDLVLIGIVDGGSRDCRAVIFSGKDKNQQLYRIGDLVAGAQIKSILWGKVILRTDGGDEVLEMSETASRHSRNVPVAAPAPVASPVSPQENIAASSDSWVTDSRMIPEKVRLVLPDQEGPGVQNATQSEAQQEE